MGGIGDMGGDSETSEKRRQKQPFRGLVFKGHGGGLGDMGGELDTSEKRGH